jgi:hypothetical protein
MLALIEKTELKLLFKMNIIDHLLVVWFYEQRIYKTYKSKGLGKYFLYKDTVRYP